MKKQTIVPPEAIALFVSQAKRGDREALESLYRHFAWPMRRFALARVNDPMIAEDVVQNVWLKVEKRLHRLNDLTLFQSWLYRALKWEILDWAKSAESQSHKAQEPLQDNSLQMISLPPLLAALPESESEVVELVYLNGLTIEQAALVINIPPGTIKSRLYRARERLRAILNEECTHETG
ncbi:RNA polymerase sigma factor [Alteromonas sp. H39]|uniref:RNA polymerase sigma factor n=1 Tax=Alteromonas sp. H39 TaxID=3389876 RepID=UPI0039E09B8C